jgi:hypothetical protein
VSPGEGKTDTTTPPSLSSTPPYDRAMSIASGHSPNDSLGSASLNVNRQINNAGLPNNRGRIDMALSSIKFGEESKQVRALEELLVLLQSQETSKDLSDVGAIDVVIDAVKKNQSSSQSSSSTVSYLGACVLSCYAQHRSEQVALVRAGMIRLFSSLLAATSATDVRTQHAVLVGLGYLSASPEVRSKLTIAAIGKDCVRLIDSDSSPVIAGAIAVLANCAVEAAMAASLLKMIALEKLVPLLHHAEVDVAYSTTALIYHLTSTPNGVQRCVEAGCLNGLVRLCFETPFPSCKETGLLALSNLACSPLAQRDDLTLELWPLLTSICDLWRQEMSLTQAALTTAAALLQRSSSKHGPAAMHAGAIASMVAIASETNSLRPYALAALSHGVSFAGIAGWLCESPRTPLLWHCMEESNKDNEAICTALTLTTAWLRQHPPSSSSAPSCLTPKHWDGCAHLLGTSSRLYWECGLNAAQAILTAQPKMAKFMGRSRVLERLGALGEEDRPALRHLSPFDRDALSHQCALVLAMAALGDAAVGNRQYIMAAGAIQLWRQDCERGPMPLSMAEAVLACCRDSKTLSLLLGEHGKDKDKDNVNVNVNEEQERSDPEQVVQMEELLYLMLHQQQSDQVRSLGALATAALIVEGHWMPASLGMPLLLPLLQGAMEHPPPPLDALACSLALAGVIAEAAGKNTMHVALYKAGAIDSLCALASCPQAVVRGLVATAWSRLAAQAALCPILLETSLPAIRLCLLGLLSTPAASSSIEETAGLLALIAALQSLLVSDPQAVESFMTVQLVSGGLALAALRTMEALQLLRQMVTAAEDPTLSTAARAKSQRMSLINCLETLALREEKESWSLEGLEAIKTLLSRPATRNAILDESIIGTLCFLASGSHLSVAVAALDLLVQCASFGCSALDPMVNSGVLPLLAEVAAESMTDGQLSALLILQEFTRHLDRYGELIEALGLEAIFAAATEHAHPEIRSCGHVALKLLHQRG